MPELRSGFLRVAPHTYVNVNRIRAVRPFYEDTDVCDPSSALVELDQGDGYYLAGQTPDDVLAAIHHEPDQQQITVNLTPAGRELLTQPRHDDWNADARATYRGMVDDLVSPAHASKRGRP